MTGGELFDRIVNLGYYGEDDARSIAKNILDATAYLHGHNIVHRVRQKFATLNYLGLKTREPANGYKGREIAGQTCRFWSLHDCYQ